MEVQLRVHYSEAYVASTHAFDTTRKAGWVAAALSYPSTTHPRAKLDLVLRAADCLSTLRRRLAAGLDVRPIWSENMVMSSERSVAASEFKARCLALLDHVAETGEPLIVTKRGRPVARVVPARQSGRTSLRGSVTVRGDIVAPILDAWDVDR